MTETMKEETGTTYCAPRRTRGRALGFVAGAAFMCVVSAGVGAGAATLVTSAQIKDSTIVGRDVKNGGLTGRDVKARSLTGKHLKDGTVSGADLQNESVESADVKNGTIDTADLSSTVAAQMVDATIPSGMTVTGVMVVDMASDALGDYQMTVTLPGRAHAPLTSDMVNFGGADLRISDGSAECTGTPAAPTAPAGMVCVYLAGATNDSASFFGSDVAGTSSDQAFGVYWFDDATGSDNVFAKVSWAYTAP